MRKPILVKDLQLGDVIDLELEAYGYATVWKMDEDGTTHVWRPYVHVGGCVYAGNRLIPFIGLENFSLLPTSEVKLVRKGPKLT